MSTSIKVLLSLSVVAFLAACAQQEEEVIIVEPEPIMAEEPMGKM